MRTVALPDGKHVPALGQGTWRMGESKNARANEVAALRLGIELGMSLVDTAEMYGDGGAEEIVAEVIHGQRQCVFVVTKVYPHNASRLELPKACERSLKRLRVDAIDLYLLHWRERTPPLQETVDAFEKLHAAGKIKASTVAHVRDNAASLKIKLTKEDLTDLDREFCAPKSKKRLPTL